MARVLRVAIMKCDSFIPPIKQQFGDVDQQFRNLLQLYKKATVESDTYECKEGKFPPRNQWNNYNGFIISGSRNSVNEDAEWIKELKHTIVGLNEEKRRIVGVCFGHQAIGSALGGVVSPNPKGWQISQHSFSINNNAMNIHSLASDMKDKVSLLCLNKEVITTPPKGFDVLGSNELCAVQGLLNDNILTFQGHPEFTAELMKALLLSRRGIIPDDVLDEGLKNVHNPIDQAWLSNVIMDFIQNGPPKV